MRCATYRMPPRCHQWIETHREGSAVHSRCSICGATRSTVRGELIAFVHPAMVEVAR